MAPLRKTRRESKQDQSTGGTGYGSSAGAGAIRGKERQNEGCRIVGVGSAGSNAMKWSGVKSHGVE